MGMFDFVKDVFNGAKDAVKDFGDDVIGIDDSGGLGTSVWDYYTGETGERAAELESRSKTLETESKALNDKATFIQSEYVIEKFLYKDNPAFSFVMTSNDLKYLKYTYPKLVEDIQKKIDSLNIDIKQFEKDYGSGYAGSKDLFGDWAGGIITSIAMAVGSINGFLTGKEGTDLETALKSAISLVILVLLIIYAPQSAPSFAATLGFVIPTFAVYVAATVVIVALALDSMFGGSEGLISVLNVFGEMFEGLGLNNGDNIFAKFFDSFKKDSDYNAYLVFATQIFISLTMMPSFETAFGATFSKAYEAYGKLSAINDAINAREEYEKQKDEYEKNLADMQEKAIENERNARLAKLSVSYQEGNDLADYTWFEQFAGQSQWMSYKQNGLFYGVKDSPYDIMFQYDLSMLTQPTTKKLGVIYEY